MQNEKRVDQVWFDDWAEIMGSTMRRSVDMMILSNIATMARKIKVHKQWKLKHKRRLPHWK